MLQPTKRLEQMVSHLTNMASGELREIDALVLHGAKDLRLEKRAAPQPGTDEVQIAIQATGLCGSDLHYYTHGRNGHFVLQHPMCLGHESAGIVTAVPQSTTTTTTPQTNGNKLPTGIATQAQTQATSTLKVGDRVALEVGLPCRNCTLCTTGRYNLCPKLRFKSSAKTHPHLDGTLQSAITHPASLCHKLPENVTYDQGALIEPLAVSLHAINRSISAGSSTNTPLTGSSALVLGAGAVGILTAVALSASGVSKIIICDIDQARLDVASSLSHGRFNLIPYLLPKPDLSKPRPSTDEQLAISTAQAADLVSHADLGARLGFDRVFECTGLPPCVTTGIYAAAPGAKLVLVGMGNPVQTLPLGAAALREVDIIGVFRYANCYPAAVEMFASGKLDGVAEGVVTHRVKLAQDGGGDLAFRLASNAGTLEETGGKPVVKVVIVP